MSWAILSSQETFGACVVLADQRVDVHAAAPATGPRLAAIAERAGRGGQQGTLQVGVPAMAQRAGHAMVVDGGYTAGRDHGVTELLGLSD